MVNKLFLRSALLWRICLCAAPLAILSSCSDDSASNPGDDIVPDEPEKVEVLPVDLGLSVLWAPCNVGANSPEESGDYFAWGETKSKETCDWSNYSYGQSETSMTKYNLEDFKVVLEASDDAATARWGGKWRLPTKEEFEELMDECSLLWTNLNGVECIQATAQSGNIIYLPAAGQVDKFGVVDKGTLLAYYSSTLRQDYDFSAEDASCRAWHFYAQAGSYDKGISAKERCYGLPIRPVWDDNVYCDITYDSNNGSGKTYSEKHNVREDIELWENHFETKDKVFVGWSLYAHSDSALFGGKQITQNTTLYAHWKERYCTVSFKANNGTDASHEETWDITESHGYWEHNFTNVGYFFVGWNTEPDGSGTAYSKTAVSAITESMTLYAQWAKVKGTENCHEWVDLGLPSGVKWATMNVGAEAPEVYGDYFAWGETESKGNYDWSTYKYGTDYKQLTKYCTAPEYGKDGFTDGKTILDPEDDAAAANWGGKWRMPTKEECEELLNEEYCTWSWATRSGVNGCIVASKINGAYIFLPVAGIRSNSDLGLAGTCGFYWSASLRFRSPGAVCDLFFASDGRYMSSAYGSRCYGFSVRPVCK